MYKIWNVTRGCWAGFQSEFDSIGDAEDRIKGYIEAGSGAEYKVYEVDEQGNKVEEKKERPQYLYIVRNKYNDYPCNTRQIARTIKQRFSKAGIKATIIQVKFYEKDTKEVR